MLSVQASDIQYDLNDEDARGKYDKLLQTREEICESLCLI